MKQWEFNRRLFLQMTAAASAMAAAGRVTGAAAAEGEALNFWAPGIAKVGASDFSAMEEQAGITINQIAKSARADEAIQKMVVGDGQELYDALTDNGGGMEDALAENQAIVALDVGKIPNWEDILPIYQEGGAAADTIRWDGDVYGVPYISNADSMAYNADALDFEPDSWEPLFDPEFKGKVALQNDFGPTITNVAIYLKESGRLDIEDAADLSEDEVAGVCEFIITKKQEGQFRTFWDGFQNGVDLLASEEVIMSSCWEPVALVAASKGPDIRYGTMKEGHQTWNNVVMMTVGGLERGRDAQFYALANVYLSPWFGSLTLKTFGFAPQMTGVQEYIEANTDVFDEATRERLNTILENKAARYAVAGNAWQRVFPTNMRAYQDWWARVQAA